MSETRAHGSGWLALLGLFVLGVAPRQALAESSAPALPLYQRAGVLPLGTDECQELRVQRVGQGVLELRFFTEPLPVPTGPDPKTTGASLLLAASDSERASLALYHASGIYQQTAQLAAPIRFMRRGADLCVASGSQPALCGRSAGEIRGTARIAFGPGWETQLSGCAPFTSRERSMNLWFASLALFGALAALSLRTSRRARDVLAIVVFAASLGCAAVATLDPWLLPGLVLLPCGVLASALLAGWALVEQRRSWMQRLPRFALGVLVVLVLVHVRHPVWTAAPIEPAVPPLWIDSANWHPRAAHQSLEFRGRPLASVGSGDPSWLVLGGSVVFGEGVEAHQTFSAVAEDLLRADGDRRVLLNAGLQGANIHNLDRFLVDLGDSLPLEGIVLVSILNNVTLPIAAPERAGCEPSLLRAWLCNVSRNQLLFTWPKVFLPKPHNLERYRNTVRRLLTRELALGRRVVMLDEASELDEGIRVWNAEPYRAIARELAAEFGVAFHPVSDATAQLAPADRFLDGIHPTPALHVLLGRKLREILRDY